MLPTIEKFVAASRVCLVCSAAVDIRPERLPGTAPCPKCGISLWFSSSPASGTSEFILPLFTLDLAADIPKKEVIARVVNQLVVVGLIRPEYETEVVAGILIRETLGTTGIGEGIALPHTKHPRMERSIGAIFRLVASVTFDSIDHKPVHTLGVVVSPSDKPQEHLRTLAAICKDLRGR
jgi:PTS system fructose-specific IIA component/PTS system nitrogen regulatory IIA component